MFDAEPRYLASCLFGLELSAVTIARYHAACALLPREPCPELEKIIRLKLDVEAIEIALRRRRPSLTRRVHVLIYLLEFDPRFFQLYTNSQDTRARAWGGLFLHAARTAYKFTKGNYLVWRHGLV